MELIRRGDIWLVDYRPGGREGEAGQIHPGVVVTNNASNAVLPLMLTIPLTSNTARLYPTNVLLPNHRTGLDHDSKAQLEALTATNVSRLRRRIGHVPEDLMTELDAKLKAHLAL